MSAIREAYDRLVSARAELEEEFSDSSLSATTGYEPDESVVAEEKAAGEELIRLLDTAHEVDAHDALVAYVTDDITSRDAGKWRAFEEAIRPLVA